MLKEEKNVESNIKKEKHLRYPEEKGPSTIKNEEHTRHHGNKDIDSSKHMLPPQEELEVIINLCGSKKELIDVLNHINHMIIEAPKRAESEIKVRKLR